MEEDSVVILVVVSVTVICIAAIVMILIKGRRDALNHDGDMVDIRRNIMKSENFL